MKKYERIELEIAITNVADIITTSTEVTTEDINVNWAESAAYNL